jgi:hypothetical protein
MMPAGPKDVDASKDHLDHLNWEESKMRSIAFVLATFVASASTAAQGWEEYSYPDYAFSVAFPADPQVDTTTYQVVDNRSVPARIYSVRQANVVLRMMVAELEGTNLEESAVVDHAINTLSQGATVRLNIPARIYQVYGRQLTVEGADGSRSMVQLFDYKDRLYQIEAKALPGQNVSNPQSDVVRFHQSLSFNDGGSNRSEEAVRAIREVCRGLANPAFGAGLDDPACTVR